MVVSAPLAARRESNVFTVVRPQPVGCSRAATSCAVSGCCVHNTSITCHSASLIRSDMIDTRVVYICNRCIDYRCSRQALLCGGGTLLRLANLLVDEWPDCLTNRAWRWQAGAGFCGYDVMVACQLPKLNARVRFPLPAPSQPGERACRAPTGAISAGDQKRRPSGRLFRVSSDGVAPPRSSFVLPASKADSAAPPPAAPYSAASPNGGRLCPNSRSNSAAASTMFVPGPKIATVPTDFRKS